MVMLVLVDVRMEIEVAVAPADEESERQEDDQGRNRRLGALLHPLGKILLEEEDRKAEEHERQSVAEAPERAEPCRRTARALTPRGNQRRDGGDVIRIGRVAEAEKHRDENHDADGGAAREACNCVVESEHDGCSPAFPDRFR